MLPVAIGVGSAVAGIVSDNSKNRDAYNALQNFESEAASLMDDPSFTQMRKHGLGRMYTNDHIRSTLAGVRPQIMEKADQTAMSLANGGMEFSGLMGKASAGGVGDLATVAAGAEQEAWQQNEAVKMNANNQALQVSMHQDSIEMQRLMGMAGLDAGEKSWIDRGLEGIALGNAYMK